MTQKFFAGDLVYVAKDLGPSMEHFESGQRAIVLYSYADKYDSVSCGNTKDFGLYLIDSKRTVAWYHEHQLTLIEPDRFDLLPTTEVLRRNHDAKRARDAELKA